MVIKCSNTNYQMITKKVTKIKKNIGTIKEKKNTIEKWYLT